MPGVETLGIAAGRVEHQQGLAGAEGVTLRSRKQCRAHALLPGVPMDQHFRDLPAMWLIFGLRPDDLNGADDSSCGVFGGQHDPQNASALARDIGYMKLTDAPPSTQSISTSLNP
jgi:hypothetical protein